MKRLYYLTPTITSAEAISEDLHDEGVTDWNFHILSKDEAGLYSHHLHSANLLQRTDIVRYMERGLIVGLLMGACFAIPLYFLEEFTFGAWMAISVFCLLFGVWCGGIGGITRDNYKIERFHEDIESGKYLLMIDVHKHDEDVIKRVMAIRHPEARLQGHTSTHTNPFSAPLQA